MKIIAVVLGAFLLAGSAKAQQLQNMKFEEFSTAVTGRTKADVLAAYGKPAKVIPMPGEEWLQYPNPIGTVIVYDKSGCFPLKRVLFIIDEEKVKEIGHERAEYTLGEFQRTWVNADLRTVLNCAGQTETSTTQGLYKSLTYDNSWNDWIIMDDSSKMPVDKIHFKLNPQTNKVVTVEGTAPKLR